MSEESYRLVKFEDWAGTQYLLEIWNDGLVRLASRTASDRTWSPPMDILDDRKVDNGS